jgi:biotin carboxyl carrier protein
MAQIDTGVLLHQIPGGMYSNLVNQLKEAKALDRIQEVMAELPRTRKELGSPPLVTPTSQIVGTQAVMNVLFGRYKMVPAEVKGVAYGLYGKTPAPIDPKVQKMILKGYERGETPITVRPGEILEPEWDKAVKATKGLAKNDGDVLIYALYPTTGQRFLKWKYGLEEVPEEVKGKTLEQIKLEDEVYRTIKQKNLFAKVKELLENLEKAPPAKGAALRTFNVFVDGQHYEVEVEALGGTPVLTGVTPKAAAMGPGVSPVVAAAPAPAPVSKATAAPRETLAAGEVPLRAPMPGMIISYSVQVGDKVAIGDLVCVLEAMKMQNSLPAPAAGVVKAINFDPGVSVAKDTVILVIGK